MSPDAIRALIHEHRAAGRAETAIVMEQMLGVVEELGRAGWLIDMRSIDFHRFETLRKNAREVLA